MKYEDLLEKDEWEVKRYEILARDNYTCQIVDAEVLTMIYFSLFLV